MAQGVIADVPPSPTVMNTFQRRLSMASGYSENVKNGAQPCVRPSPVRCLFGPPDREASAALAAKIEGRAQWAFSRKFNFNITGKVTPTALEPTDSAAMYQWNEKFDDETMCRLDRLRFEAPIAPNTRPATLLSAPTVEPEPVSHDESSMTLPESQQQVQPITVEIKEQQQQPKKCELTLNLFSFSVSPPDDGSLTTPPSAKRGRTLPVPFTILPESPSPYNDEHEQDDDHDEDHDIFSPLPQRNSAIYTQPISPTDDCKNRTPMKRRSSCGIFNFESPTTNMRCLRIVNGSPGRTQSKVMKQRVITDYMRVTRAYSKMNNKK